MTATALAPSRLQLGRPPSTKDELWWVVNSMFGVALPRVQVCEDHQAPFDAFADAYFGNPFNWALWYGSRGCLAGDTQITVSRAGNSTRRRMDRFVPRYLGDQSSLGRHLGGGRGYRKDIPTMVQRSQDGHARLGQVAQAYESGEKTTYELVTTSGRRIRATAEHPFDTPGGFVPLGELGVGDEVLVNVGRSGGGRKARRRYAPRPAKWHPLADRGQYWEHRLVAEARMAGLSLDAYLEVLNGERPPALGYLSSDTHVHHVDGNPTNNAPGNLLVLPEVDHHRLHAEMGKSAHVWERIDTERVASITRYGQEMTFDLTMADAPNNYVANGFVVHNTGKSYMLAILALVKAAILEIDVTLLGGSMAQSTNVHEHVENLMLAPNAPRQMVESAIQSELSFGPGNWIRPLPASQKTVRGPHPQMTLLDEIDEMEKKVYDAAMGQAMNKPNKRGIKVGEMVVASSTWQRPIGTFQEVIDDARAKGMPTWTWCLSGGSTGVITARGEVDITAITTDDLVLTRQGWKTVQHVTNMGPRQTITVELSSGRSLCGTPDHLVAVGDGWVPLGSLCVGDPLTVVPHVLPQAGSTMPPVVVGRDVGVLDRVLVPVGAVGPLGLGHDVRHAPGVLSDGDGFEVAGVDARGVLAQMVQAGSGLGALQQTPDGPVSLGLAQPDVAGQHAVSTRSTTALPLPAAAVCDDGAPLDVGHVEGHPSGEHGTGDGLLDAAPAVSGSAPSSDGGAAVDAVHVVGIHPGVIADVWDIGVHDAHEFVANGVLVHNCYREVLEPHGWMEPAFIDRKRASVPAEMFRVEYELGEPAGDARAFDLEKLKKYFETGWEPISVIEKGFDAEYVYAQPEPSATYAAGADWAKEKDFTVITVVRTDETPRKLVYIRKVNRRSWPEMIALFNDVVNRYHAQSAHDATGLGNVVADYVDERSLKVKMIGQDRTKLLSEYIADFEQGAYRFPRIGWLYNAHKGTTVDEVWGTARWDSHLPDEVASAAIMHRAAERMAPTVGPEGVTRTGLPPKSLEPLETPKERQEGVVSRSDPTEEGFVLPLLPAITEDSGRPFVF